MQLSCHTYGTAIQSNAGSQCQPNNELSLLPLHSSVSQMQITSKNARFIGEVTLQHTYDNNGAINRD